MRFFLDFGKFTTENVKMNQIISSCFLQPHQLFLGCLFFLSGNKFLCSNSDVVVEAQKFIITSKMLILESTERSLSSFLSPLEMKQ